jgi:glucokinase
MPQRGEIYLGVDIGGTKVAAGLVNDNGQILFKTRSPMNASGTADEALSCVHAAIDSVLSQSRIKVSSIGVSTPGTVDLATGTVVNPYNLPCWRNYPLGDAIRSAYNLPTQVHNDGNAAGLAEAVWGAGVGHKLVLYVTIGTGIGTAVIYGGQLYLGRTHSAGEGGHMVIKFDGPKCSCGKSGCIEMFASGPAIARRAQQIVRVNGSHGKALLALSGGSLCEIKSETVARAWEQGDPLAITILEETMEMLAVWFGNVIDLIEPDVIVVGGGMSRLISSWFPTLTEKTARWCNNTHFHEIPFLEAKYGADSGIAGGAAVCSSKNAYTC